MTLDAAKRRNHRGQYEIGRAALVLASVLSMAIAAAATQAAPSEQIGDPALERVLQFMALMKFAGAAAGAWLVDWRMRAPVSARLAAGYITAIAVMLAASTLIALLVHIMTAALLYHAALLFGLLLAWQDSRSRA